MILVTILSIIGVVLNIRKKRAGFAVWIVTNGAWAIYDWQLGAYAQALLFVVYFILAIWGWMRWSKEDI